MRVTAIRQDLQHILQPMSLTEAELGLGENIDHLMAGRRERLAKVHARPAIPDDDLAQKQVGIQIVRGPQYAILNAVLVLVEDGAIVGDQRHVQRRFTLSLYHKIRSCCATGHS